MATENTPQNKKLQDLEANRSDGTDEFLTTNQGLRINDNQNSLKAGERGATLLEDFILREKITHFDHERIPERIVHARGSAAARRGGRAGPRRISAPFGVAFRRPL